jgi:predicted NAD/FAD-dependent oxidoreductase
MYLMPHCAGSVYEEGGGLGTRFAHAYVTVSGGFDHGTRYSSATPVPPQ